VISIDSKKKSLGEMKIVKTEATGPMPPNVENTSGVKDSRSISILH